MPAATNLTFDPTALVGLGIAALVLWMRAASLPAQKGGRWRVGAVLLGAAAVVAAEASPITTLAQHYLLAAHLVQVTLTMAIAAPLLLLGLPHGIWRPLPPRLHWLRWMAHPMVAVALVNLGLFGWHETPLYDAALHNPALQAAEQTTLLLAALAFWWALIGPLQSSRHLSAFARMNYILLATIPQTVAGIAIALTHHVIYPGYGGASQLLGIDPLDDQAAAGSALAVLVAILLVVSQVASTDGDTDEDLNREWTSTRPAPIGPTPQWVTDLWRVPLPDEPLGQRPQGAGTKSSSPG